MQDRLCFDLPFEEYAAAPGFNASVLKQGAASPKHLAAALEQTKAETAAMRWGRLVHAAVLEPSTLASSSVVCALDRRTKAFREFKLEHQGVEILTPDENASLFEISAAVHSNQAAANMIQNCKREVSVFWEDPDIGPCKARLDGLNPSVFWFEFKTTARIRPFDFFRTAYDMKYHWQLGWYAEGLRAVTGMELPGKVITVEQKPPHDVVVYNVSRTITDTGFEEAHDLAATYVGHTSQGLPLPGVEADVLDFELPEWAMVEEPVRLVSGGKDLVI